MVEAITENVSPASWTVEYTCSPAGPYTVGVLGEGVACSDDSELAAAINDSTTSITVTTTGKEWVDTELPWDITIGGERMTVTAISGTAPQTFTVTRAVNGVEKSHAIAASVELAEPARLAL
jgi:hypothetical protein